MYEKTFSEKIKALREALHQQEKADKHRPGSLPVSTTLLRAMLYRLDANKEQEYETQDLLMQISTLLKEEKLDDHSIQEIRRLVGVDSKTPLPEGQTGTVINVKDLAVSLSAYYYRRSKGMSHEDAASMPPMRRTQPLKYITEKQRKIAERNGLSVGIVNGRIRRGIPVEIAISQPPSRKGVKLPREKVEVRSDGQEDELYGSRGAQEG